MNRAVYVGGFSGSKAQAEAVSNALSSYYENDVEPFTFAETMKRPEIVRKACIKTAVVTHSAGMLALRESGGSPIEIHAFAPPLPFTLRQIAARTIVKTMQMNANVHSMTDAGRVARFNLAAMSELTAHPFVSFGNLPKIAKFDAVEAANAAQASGIDTSLAYGSLDKYFQITPDNIETAVAAGVNVIILEDGVHDDLVLHPEKTLHDYFESD
jgi:hypothetical protein